MGKDGGIREGVRHGRPGGSVGAGRRRPGQWRAPADPARRARQRDRACAGQAVAAGGGGAALCRPPAGRPGTGRVARPTPPDTVITAARVAWLPRERDGERRIRWADVLSQVNPRRPPQVWQRAIMRREPGRAQMVVAEPATVAALRERWGGTGSFAHFVSRQASLALDRAERAQL